MKNLMKQNVLVFIAVVLLLIISIGLNVSNRMKIRDLEFDINQNNYEINKQSQETQTMQYEISELVDKIKKLETRIYDMEMNDFIKSRNNNW